MDWVPWTLPFGKSKGKMLEQALTSLGPGRCGCNFNSIISERMLLINFVITYTPRFNEVERGYTGFTLSIGLSVDRIMSALYLQQYSLDPFDIWTSYQATSEGVWGVRFVAKYKGLKFWQILEIGNFNFVFLWLGIQYDSIVWVIMRRWGYPQNEGVLVLVMELLSGECQRALLTIKSIVVTEPQWVTLVVLK